MRRGSLLELLSLKQSFSGTAIGIICSGEVIQGFFFNQPGIVDFIRRQVTLAAKAFYRFRVDFKPAGSFQDTKIIVQYRHTF
jgi:hypothetical protein